MYAKTIYDIYIYSVYIYEKIETLLGYMFVNGVFGEYQYDLGSFYFAEFSRGTRLRIFR